MVSAHPRRPIPAVPDGGAIRLSVKRAAGPAGGFFAACFQYESVFPPIGENMGVLLKIRAVYEHHGWAESLLLDRPFGHLGRLAIAAVGHAGMDNLDIGILHAFFGGGDTGRGRKIVSAVHRFESSAKGNVRKSGNDLADDDADIDKHPPTRVPACAQSAEMRGFARHAQRVALHP